MGSTNEKKMTPNSTLLQSNELHQYIMNTAVHPREAKSLKELREATASHPWAFFGTSPDVGQLMAILLKLINAKRTIEIGVYTGYSLLLTALTVPDDGHVTAIDPDREVYEIGLPIIQGAGVAHKIDFIEAKALPVLDKLLEDKEKEGSFDFAFVDADKGNYLNYHERLMKLVRVGGLIIYDNTLWGGTVALPEEAVPETKRAWRASSLEFNKVMTADKRVEICLASLGDGILICRRAC
ncbi:hypothetical protein SAY87_009357 [Trapa incisa]|uniref:Caffeoyl-CoA O-methyltransferase n=2 Tax=Trapa TaxID=22665 RepID=A0AAN7M494_TRANT|nr:hypothetical protein SAY87_009357 [Trapa incisa]KAK4797489.1 hypothetical protein SAY86_029815 [Trapa natans]